MEMRGLSVFISEIRKCSTKEQEQKRVDKELSKVMNRFRQSNKMKGYDRKKNVCKLLYIHMMGYDVDFGHIEAVNLLSSNKYSEKHMGYLACTLLLHEEHELVTLITNSIKRDLNSRNPHDQCLGLTALANIGGKEQAETLAQDVLRLLVRSESKLLVKKKAALTMLRMYRKYPDILPPEMWASRVMTLLGARDFGVVTSVMSLLLGLAENDSSHFSDAMSKVVRLLVKLVLSAEHPSNYLYYGIPSPWLQVKLLRFLQYYDPPEDSTLMNHIAKILQRIMHSAERIKADRKSVSRINAAHAVLFEALNLLISYDNDKNMLVFAAKMLGRYLQDRDTNLRYFALDTLSRMALSMHSEVKSVIARHQDVVLFALKDPDISIRRRALDLLYSMCDRENAGQIVGEMLSYLPIADYGIREELVLKIAILAEKYAADFTWYVDVILNLIAQSGDFVSDDIWYRVVQIVTNRNVELQKYTAGTVLQAIMTPSAHENAVKVAGYVLGEFGYLVADEEESNGLVQFETLFSKFETASPSTKQILLSTFIKFFNLYEDFTLRQRIKDIFHKYRHVVDAELQQRALEYFALSEMGDYDLLGTVFENMPMFPERESSVMKRILERQSAKSTARKIKREEDEEEEEGEDESGAGHEVTVGNGATTDMNVGPATDSSLLMMDDAFGSQVSGGQQPPANVPQQQNGADALSSLDDLLGLGSMTSQPAPAPPTYNAPPAKVAQGGAASTNNLDDIFGLGDDSTSQQPASPPQDFAAAAAARAAQFATQRGDASIEDKMMVTKDQIQQSSVEKAHAEAAKKYTDLLVSDSGVAIEDDRLQIKIGSEYHLSKGRISLEYANKTSRALNQIRTQFTEIPQLKLQFSQCAPLVAPNTLITQYLQIECLAPFEGNVELNVFFEYEREPYRFNIRLPIVAHKFIEPLNVSDTQSFFAQWHKIPKGAPLEMQEIVRSPTPVDVNRCKEIIGDGFNLEVMSHIDTNPQNFVAAGTFHSQNGKHVVLVRLESNPNAQAYRLTVRSTNDAISRQVHSLLKQQILREDRN